MELNNAYKAEHTLKQTIKMISFIYKELIKRIDMKFKPLHLDSPMHDIIDSKSFMDISDKSRRVTYDLGVDYNIVSQYNSNSFWMKNMSSILEQPLLMESKFVYRDIKIDIINSNIKDIISLTIPLKNKDDIKPLFLKYVSQIYSIIYDIGIMVEEKFNIKNILEQEPEIIESQMLENEMKYYSPIEREKQILEECQSFILKSPGKMMFSGMIHQEIDPGTFDLNNYAIIISKERNNYFPIQLAEIGIFINGQDFKDQINMYNKKQNISGELYNDLINEEGPTAFKIDFDKTAIYQMLLAKGHLAEVQPNVISSNVEKLENKNIIVSYKIKKV